VTRSRSAGLRGTAIPTTRDLVAALRWRAGAVKRSLRADTRYASESYAQEGEDLILKRMFGTQAGGFYVDVGAHHPMRFSNTYLFYKSGWRGINIDANPGSMAAFEQVRPEDTNLQLAISDKPQTLRYHVFDDPALNTFSVELAAERERTTSYRIVRTAEIGALPLADVLARHLARGQQIDFLTVDVEGWDLKVLQSNDWDRFAPRVVVAEALGQTLEDVRDSEIVVYLRARRYSLFAKTFNSIFLKRA
jgi:FkbM family methyltransferase